MRFNIWADLLEKATVLPNGLKLYTFEATGGPRPFRAYLWFPKATNPVGQASYSFKTEDDRAAWVRTQVQAFAEHQARKIARRASAQPTDDVLNMANPGAIFYNSWGYDQTNIDYWQVTKRSGSLVTLARIAQETVRGSEGHMSEWVRPRKDAFVMKCRACGVGQHGVAHYELSARGDYHPYDPIRDEIKKRVSVYEGQPHISFDHGAGSLVQVLTFGNAEPLAVASHYQSHYH